MTCLHVQGFKETLLEDVGGSANAYDPTYKFIESVAAEIVQTEQQVLCHWDPTLEADLPRLSGKKFLLAANFRNNEELLPHAIVQFWHLLALLPEGSAFVSIYESGSTDSTGWCLYLCCLLTGVPISCTPFPLRQLTLDLWLQCNAPLKAP